MNPTDQHVRVPAVDDDAESLLAPEARLSDASLEAVTAAFGREAPCRVLWEEFAVMLMDARASRQRGHGTQG